MISVNAKNVDLISVRKGLFIDFQFGATAAQERLAVQFPLRLNLPLCPWARHFTYFALCECECMCGGGQIGLMAAEPV